MKKFGADRLIRKDFFDGIKTNDKAKIDLIKIPKNQKVFNKKFYNFFK